MDSLEIKKKQQQKTKTKLGCNPELHVPCWRMGLVIPGGELV